MFDKTVAMLLANASSIRVVFKNRKTTIKRIVEIAWSAQPKQALLEVPECVKSASLIPI